LSVQVVLTSMWLFRWLPILSEPAAPVSTKMIDSTAAAKVTVDYVTLNKNQTGLSLY
jgi:hypothetical protein